MYLTAPTLSEMGILQQPRFADKVQIRGAESRWEREMPIEIAEILANLEHQDTYQLLKHGMSEDVERQAKLLCAEYENRSSDGRDSVRRAITSKVQNVMLSLLWRWLRVRCNTKTTMP
jgi:hypothetical protein